ncbi:MAG: hypothetical protein ACYDD0_09785 [Candidatus Dormibacteria bacterium]
MPTFNHIRAEVRGPGAGLVREARIRWILFRRSHRLASWQVMMLVAAVLATGIGLAAYSSHRSDQALRQQLVQLQAQTLTLNGQVRAERQELAAASSPAWQSELARAQGLAAPGQQVYVIESPAAVAGPTPAEQGVQEVGHSVELIASGVLGLA